MVSGQVFQRGRVVGAQMVGRGRGGLPGNECQALFPHFIQSMSALSFCFLFSYFFFCISALNCLLRFPLAKQLLKPKFAKFFSRGRGRAGPPLAQVSRMGLRTANGLPAQCRLTTSSWVGVGVQGAESLLCSAALVLAGSDLVPGPGRALPARTFALINSRLPQACSTPPPNTHTLPQGQRVQVLSLLHPVSLQTSESQGTYWMPLGLAQRVSASALVMLGPDNSAGPCSALQGD